MNVYNKANQRPSMQKYKKIGRALVRQSNSKEKIFGTFILENASKGS